MCTSKSFRHMSVCLSVTSRYCIETAEKIELFLEKRLVSAYPIVYYKEISKITIIPSVPNSMNVAYKKLCHARHVYRRKCCQQSTDDRRLFIVLSVHLCVPCNGSDVARVRLWQLTAITDAWIGWCSGTCDSVCVRVNRAFIGDPAFIWTFDKYPPAFNRDPAFIRSFTVLC